MERLNKQTADFLQSLIDMENEGRDVSDYVLDVMDGTAGTDTDYNCIVELADRKLLAADAEKGFCRSDALTPAGRNYFIDLADSDARARKAVWSDRRFQIGLSLLTLILSTVAGWIAGHF